MPQTGYSQTYPLGTPSVSGNQYTVDLMLKEPTRINAYLSDVTLLGYYAERIFGNAGGVSGGALVYNQLLANDTLPVRRSLKIAPGAEFPEITFDRPEPLTAQVEKTGGRFDVTDEARDRNDMHGLQSDTVKLGNDIRDQLHTRALTELAASVTAIGSAVTMAATSWSDAAALTLTTTANALLPSADFSELRRRNAVQGLGTKLDLLIMHPNEKASLDIVYQGRATEVLAANGFDWEVSNLVTAGTAFAVQEGLVGQVRYEQPLQTVTYREDANEKTWTQASVRAVFAVTNPYNVMKLTGLAA